MATVALHPQLREVAFLLGTWTGEGAGEYPTIQPFRYREEIRFWHNGKPFLAYQQRTHALDDGRPLHAEMGYLRAVSEGQVEFVIAQAIGFAEVDLGRLRGTRIELESRNLHGTPTAKPVTAVRRVLWMEGESLAYELSMAMTTVPMTHHLSARFARSSD